MSASDPSAIAQSARTVLAALGDGPIKLFVVGGIGTGKSTALKAVRHELRAAGREVATRFTDDAATAVVVDDAHLLSEDDLTRLARIAQDPRRTVVVATQARDHHPELVRIGAALESEHPRITLGPLPTGEIARTLADPSGHPPSAELLAAAMQATGGIPLLVAAAGAAPHPLSAATVGRAADYALNNRLRRLSQDDLEALLITSLSDDLGGADVAAALGISVHRAAELVDNARGAGLTEPSRHPEFVRSVHRSVAALVGAARHHEVETALLRTQLAASTLSARLGLELAEHGVGDRGLADWLRERAATQQDSADRTRWYRAAVGAGADDLRPGLADALALSGDCGGAAALADELLAADAAADRAGGVRVAGSVASHDGNTGYGAELFTWLGPFPDALVGSAATIVQIAAGDPAAARRALEAANAGPPTSAARAARSLAEGMLATLDGYSFAATKLGQAVAGEHTGVAVAMPDSTPALVTLAALHSGDAVRARSVISRAVRAGADPAYSARHRLLQGWVRMQDGQLAAAAADADAAGSGLHGRDALWAAALRTAIARRGGDTGALQTHWSAGMDVLAEFSIDLFSVLPLGELWVAAARLRRLDRVTAAVDQAFAVLAALGRPTAWVPLLHWAGVHAGILAGDPAAVAPHGQALTGLAQSSPFAAALAGAGRAWLQVLAGQVDPDEVIAAARRLAGFGLTSDATRLAGQAALQAPDAKTSALMLQVARDLKLGPGDDLPTAATEPALTARPAPLTTARSAPLTTARPAPLTTALSDREREVAELVLLGMPYRDIGAQLFISAKTVEHHVARIRRRLGAQSRPEMLSMLRAMLT